MELLNEKNQIKGNICYFGLVDWWLSAFTEVERQYIQNKLGDAADTLLYGEIRDTSLVSAVSVLHPLTGYFLKEEERPIAYKILEKAESLLTSKTPICDVHFFYGQKTIIYYRDRKKPGYLQEAIKSCKKQIEIAPEVAAIFRNESRDLPLPLHTGYEQLAIILEKQKKFSEAIELCNEADKRGWAGDWQKRIERCNKKLSKAQ